MIPIKLADIRLSRLPASVFCIAAFTIASGEVPVNASVSWPKGRLLPTLSPPAKTLDVISLSTKFTFEAAGPRMSHASGHAEGDGWTCRPGIDPSASHMLYGPYDTDLPAGANLAWFDLKIDDNTADDSPVATIDVNDASTNAITATRTITRREFTSTGRYQRFDLPFAISALGHSMEFRVQWTGNSALTVEGVTVKRSALSESAVLFASLKGIVNAKRPRIFSTDDTTGAEEGAGAWLTALNLGYKRISDPWTLISKYRKEISGLVVYDDNVPDTINLATTIAGGEKALVASPLFVATLTAAPYNLPILQDLRGKYTDKLAVYEDLYEKYWPHVTHKAIVGIRPTEIFGFVREYCVAINAAAIWLDPRDPAENALLSKFLSSMGPGAVYLGWWGEEQSGVKAASAYGIATCASDFSSNLSVFGGTPRSVAVKGTPPMPPLQNKIYVAFVVSDGDNLQYVEHHMRKMWDDPGRGSVPIGWTISPVTLDAMPGVLNYYYQTATPNDCLVSGPSGVGYTYPNHWSNPGYLAQYIAKSNDYCLRAGLRIITVWNSWGEGINQPVGEAYSKYAPSLLGLTAMNNAGGMTIYSNSLPSLAFEGNYCSTEKDLRYWIDQGAHGWKGDAPLFLIVQAEPWHGIMPSNIKHVADSLGADYVVVRPDTLFQMIRRVDHLPTIP